MPKSGFWGYNKYVNSLHKKLEIGLLFVYLIISFIYIFKFESTNIWFVIFHLFRGYVDPKDMDGMEV